MNRLEEKPISRRERKKRQTRDQLKTATAELLIEVGYDAISIQQITDRADLARATFYLHFGDVEEAVWAVVTDQFTDLAQLMWLDEGGSSAERRYLKWVRVFKFLEARQPFMRAALGENGHIRLYQRLVGLMGQTLEGDMQSGRVERTTELPIRFEAQFYAGAVLNTILWWLSQAEKPSAQEMAEMIHVIVTRRTIDDF